MPGAPARLGAGHGRKASDHLAVAMSWLTAGSWVPVSTRAVLAAMAIPPCWAVWARVVWSVPPRRPLCLVYW